MSDDSDERMYKWHWQILAVCLLKTLIHGTKPVAVNEETHIPQKQHWRVNILFLKVYNINITMKIMSM